jgi:hypothetical protein
MKSLSDFVGLEKTADSGEISSLVRKAESNGIISKKRASSSETSPLVRKVESNGTISNKRPRSLRAAERDVYRVTDPLIQGLIERLPKPEDVWSLDDRAKWLDLANRIFDLVYSAGDDEQRKIEVEIVELSRGTRLSREDNVVVAPSLSRRLSEEHRREATEDAGNQ